MQTNQIKTKIIDYSYKKELKKVLIFSDKNDSRFEKIQHNIINEQIKLGYPGRFNAKDYYELNYDLIRLLQKRLSYTGWVSTNIAVSQNYYHLVDLIQEYYFGILKNCFNKIDVGQAIDELNKIQADIFSKYDETCFYLLQNNDWYAARNYYFIFAENLLKRAYFLINYNPGETRHYLGNTYYQAGRAYLRSEEILKDKFIYTAIAPPHLVGFKSSELFKLGNKVVSPLKYAELSFECAKKEFKKTHDREMIFKTKEYLAQIAIESNFGKQLFGKIIEITRQLLYKKNYFWQLPKKYLSEAAFRDYYLAYLNLILSANSVAENLKGKGRTDISVIFRDTKGELQEGIIELKIWGVGNYKKVSIQLRKYLNDYDSFGIIIVINKNKKDITQDYIKLIKKDKLFVDSSIDEKLMNKQNFVNIESTFSENDKIIKIYHVILNVHKLIN